ncbi:MAG: aminoacyl-histidine dipeptidase [Clostridiales bacterium]|nr:aminoacyl-histidine dipeptidase [Clostridiales bacterium]
MRVLQDLKPQGVWRFFEDLCAIPHGSYNEKGVSDYCAAFARERGLEYYQDEAWNVVIIKEASAGYEDAEPLILQGHLDMVCEKKQDCDLDFMKDGLRLKVDGDYVYAEGTTLGGDDGIAIAYALAILDDDSIVHPRLEAVFTTAEEVGMDGVKALDVSMLKGHTVLNLDSEEEGTLLVGCAGGCGAVITLPVQREAASGIFVKLTVGGLLGGHSGAEIDKGRGNANILLARVLGSLEGKADFRILTVSGGRKDNAIPRESTAELLVPAGELEKVKAVCRTCDAELKAEYASTDAGVSVELTAAEEKEAQVLDAVSAQNILTMLLAVPNGIQTMSADIQGLVETSLNLGVLVTEDAQMELRYSVRSSVGTAKDWLTRKMELIAGRLGGSVEVRGPYPAWEYRKDSPLREDMVRIYEEMFGAAPKVEAIHAGLECGILASKIEDLDCVSMGPDMLDIHTTEERASIASVERMWNYILEILKRK